MDDIAYVQKKLDWMSREGIWPGGLRYLWTDAFGLVLLLSLYRRLGEQRYLDQALELVDQVQRVLGRERGLRIGEAPDRDGQYFHYLAMWIFALYRLGEIRPEYHARAVSLVKDIHPAFVLPGVGVIWKMAEDLSAPYPGYGLGALDHFHGYVIYRLLDRQALSAEIADMADLVEANYRRLRLDQDLGLGMMLWMSHFFPQEPWAAHQRQGSLEVLDTMWMEPPGYFCRHPRMPDTRFAFTNYGVSLGLQAVGATPHRVKLLNDYFEGYRSGDEYDREAITWVMACTSRLPGLFLRAGAGA